MPQMDGYAFMRKIRQILDDRPAGRFRRSLWQPMLDKLTSNRRSPLAFWRHLAKPARSAEIMKIVARLCGPNGKTTA
ncbi:hypothetical protein [Microcoleus sp. D2_18a_D3]|uniref:hypothetical protein n=1 Tax=Microcoleus sp. D2_18a_D3 TaxID=3055330 RepID=UPI002FD33407